MTLPQSHIDVELGDIGHIRCHLRFGGVERVELGIEPNANCDTPNDSKQMGAQFERCFAAYLAGDTAPAESLCHESPDGTPFQRSVWDAIASIPFGETRTYQWLAEKIGQPKASRAVGNACGANPLPLIIPCHRVLASSGLGGFSGPKDWKQSLLDHERIVAKKLQS